MGAAVGEKLGEGLGERSAHAVSIVWPVDAASALADLTEISSQVEAAAVVDADGAVLGSTLPDEPATDRLVQAGVGLFDAATSRFGSSGRSVTQLEAALREGSIFVVREDGLGIVARTSAGPDLRARLLRPEDLPARRRRDGEEAEAEAPAAGEEDGDGRCVSCSGLPCWSAASSTSGAAATRAASASSSTSTTARRVTLADDAPDAQPLLALARRGALVDELGVKLREHALLEGDFLLRSGRRSSYYLDKYRFETRPELLGPLGERLAAAAREHEPDAVRLAGPALGAVALAASASLASGLPFVIVRDSAKEYGTANRLEGPFEQGELVCLIEDVVTSGGALAEAVDGAAGGRARRPKRRSASSTGRRAARTRWPVSASACAPSTGQETWSRPLRPLKIRMVEPRNR